MQGMVKIYHLLYYRRETGKMGPEELFNTRKKRIDNSWYVAIEYAVAPEKASVGVNF